MYNIYHPIFSYSRNSKLLKETKPKKKQVKSEDLKNLQCKRREIMRVSCHCTAGGVVIAEGLENPLLSIEIKKLL